VIQSILPSNFIEERFVTVEDIEHNGDRFIWSADPLDEALYYRLRSYKCKPDYEPDTIRNGYALSSFLNTTMRLLHEDWLQEQPIDVQNIVNAYRDRDEGCIRPVHYHFQLHDDGKVTVVTYYLEKEHYLKLFTEQQAKWG
jgi:hypothetical protein